MIFYKNQCKFYLILIKLNYVHVTILLSVELNEVIVIRIVIGIITILVITMNDYVIIFMYFVAFWF